MTANPLLTNAKRKRFNERRYSALLVEALPRPIETEEENEEALALIESLCGKDDLSLEETSLLQMVSMLVRAFEDEHYAIPKASPASVLNSLIENRGLKKAELAPVVGSARALNAILKGEREPSQQEAVRLGEYFQLAPRAFVSA